MSEKTYPNEILSNVQPDPIDTRDYIFVASTNNLPTSVDLRESAGEIENQLSTGSCVANATVSALEIILEKGNKFFDLSRLFLYYNLREPYDNLKGKDIGSYLRDGFKFTNKFGICSEDTWPFITSKVNTKPSDKAYEEAQNHKVTKYERIPGFSIFGNADMGAIMLMKAALAKGFPVTISMKLGRTFYDLRDQKDLTKHNYIGLNGDSIGGHAMCVVGYDDKLDGFIVENSWGKEWGDDGYCLIKYSVIMKDCHDVWVCTEFDGITLEPEWEDNSPELKLERNVIKIYKGEPRTVTLSPKIISGTPPYTFVWKFVTGFNGSGHFINSEGEEVSETTEQNPKFVLYEKYNSVGLMCRVYDSSPLKKTEVAYTTINYIDEERPEPKPEPDEPKPEPDDDKKKYFIIAGVVLLVILGIVLG